MRLRFAGALLLLATGLAFQHPASAQAPPCPAAWIPTYGGWPFPGDLNASILAQATFDDGHGPALYASVQTDSYAAGSLSRWDGWGWKPISSTAAGKILALASYDDGNGARLYAAGEFTAIGGVAANHIAKWDGATWTALGSGTVGAWIGALRVFDDGSGPALYAGGVIANAGGILAQNLARWNGAGWSAMATGMDAGIRALCGFDDGSGFALYAGGDFTSAGGAACNHVARWNGSGWSALGSGVSAGGAGSTTVKALGVFDDGGGPALFAGGIFTQAGGQSANRVAKWDGAQWSALGSGMNDEVSALAVFDDGGGAALFAGGRFGSAGGSSASCIAKWDGNSWSVPLLGVHTVAGTGDPAVRAFSVFDDGSGTKLFVGGHFGYAGSLSAANVATWSAAGWAETGFGLDGTVYAVASFDDGTGPALYAAGSFWHAGSLDVRTVAKWSGTHWSALPPPLAALFNATCMAVYDDGNGPALYVADLGSNVPLSKWDGNSWSIAGNPIGRISALQVFDDGSGPALFAVAGTYGTGVFKWNGTAWSSVGGGADSPMHALAVFDDGGGPALYVGGEFSSIGGVYANQVARWTGTIWIPLGTGMAAAYPTVQALAVFDDGSGPALYAGGRFDTAGGVTANGIARWNGTSWSALGAGMALAGSVPFVSALASFDDGSGLQLFAGGGFTSANGVATDGLAKWDGAQWTDLALDDGGATPNGASIRQLAVLDDGSASGAALIVAGGFAGGRHADAFVAKWDLPLGCTPSGSSICAPGTSGVLPCPCSNPSGAADRGCDNSAATGGAQLVTTGLASLANDSVNLWSSGERPSALSVFVQGTNTIPNGVAFGQGVRCLAGTLTRLFMKGAVNGAAHAPESADAVVSARSSTLGDTIVPGQHRFYGVYYRDPNVLGGCSSASTFNITQQVDLLWAP